MNVSRAKPLSSKYISWQKAAFLGGLLALLAILSLLLGALALQLFGSQPVASAVSQASVAQMAAEEAVANSEQLVGQDNNERLTGQELPTPMATPLPTEALIPAKPIIYPASGDDNLMGFNLRPTWTVTPSPTNTPVPTPTALPTFVGPQSEKPAIRPLDVDPGERWVDVDLSEQTLYAYEGDALIFQTLISSGLPGHPTVTGQFRIWLRFESQTMDGRRLGYDYYLEDVPYVMYFFEDYALHGTYWHNNFGRPMSHGCVNMRTEDAELVFSWAGLGTVVNVHE